MTAEQLQDALSLLPSDLIEETDALRRNPRHSSIPLGRWTALAAAFVLVLGCGLFALQSGLFFLAGGKSEAAMDKAAMQECAPEEPAAAASSILTGTGPDRENNAASRGEAMEPTRCAPPVDMESAVHLRSDVREVTVELAKTAEAAEKFCTCYDEDWFREFDLLVIALPGVGSLSDISVGQGSSPTHWQIRVTEEAPAEDALLVLIPVEKGHIPKDAEFEMIRE